MRFLIIIIFFLVVTPAFSGEEMLIGSWVGGDTASMSIYGTMRISKGNITWGGHNKYHPKCIVTYTIEPEKFGVTFEDQTGHVFVTSKDSKFSTYLLRISGGECALGISHFRLTFPFENEFSYLAMVEYHKSDTLDKPMGYVHFHRRK
jgi:hypothetical protein